MEKKVEIKNISSEEVIKIFKEHEGIDITIEEAEQIVAFFKMLLENTIKYFLDQ